MSKGAPIEDSGRPFLSLILPAYNEQSRMDDTLAAAERYVSSLGKPCEIIVVDDGSVDGTRAAVERYSGAVAVRLVSYAHNMGKGYAVRQGVFASRGMYVAFSDADLSAPLEEMTRLFAALEKGYDIAIGSRVVKGAVIPVHQPLYREIGGKTLNKTIQLLAVPGIKDTQCGLKLFRGEAARDVFGRCFLNGWAFDVEVLFLARRLGYTIAEVGVKWSHAEGSKIRPFRAGLEVVKDIVRVRTHNYGL